MIMELTEAQKQAVEQWVGEGCGLSEIQERLSKELGVAMTYMEVRFLILELGLAVKDRPPAVKEIVDSGAPEGGGLSEPAPSAGADGGLGESPPGLGGVSVELDRVTKPGSIVSGTVTFSDGVKASWALDQLGRLALDARRPGYRPSAQDLNAFQAELRQALERRGF
jgi:hypothetical protein